MTAASVALTVLGLATYLNQSAQRAPKTTSLLDDHRMSNCGSQVSVADAARAAIAKLR